MSFARVGMVLGAVLFVVSLLHCDDSTTPPPEAAPPAAQAPEAAADTPSSTPDAAAAAPSAEDLNDPLRETKAALAAARKRFEDANEPIDLDVYQVEYVLLLRAELEKLGLPKSSLSRMSRQQLEERARRKGLVD